MKFIALSMAFALSSCAQPKADHFFEQYLWKNRLLLVFAPTADDELMTEQRRIISTDLKRFKNRHLRVFQVFKQGQVLIDGKVQKDLNPKAFYENFAVKKEQFTAIGHW